MSAQILKRQRVIFWGFVAAVISVSFFLFYTIKPQRTEEERESITRLDLPSDKEKPQDLLLGRIETQNEMLESRLQFLEKALIETQKNNEEAVRIKESENRKLKEDLQELKKALEEEKVSAKKGVQFEEVAFNQGDSPFYKASSQLEVTPIIQPRILTFIQSESPKQMVQHVDRTIPSGTTVRAILVSSVDAVCNVMSASDPQPVKLRVIDDGHLPKCVRAKLKGGLIIASAYGDLSSERVYIRPERLTQLKPNGEFIETIISGFVSGEDGKNGVRGTVVDKSAKIVTSAAVSGLFSGASQYLQAMIRSKYCGFGGYYGCESGPACENGTCYPYGLDVAGEGVTNGACSGLDLLTNYYIQRAEQVRPVIQVTAGRIVDITFTHSAELGDLYTKEKVRDIREEARR